MTDSPNDNQDRSHSDAAANAWAEALAEQAESEAAGAQTGARAGAEENDAGTGRADAIAEASATENTHNTPDSPAPDKTSAQDADDSVFKPLSEAAGGPAARRDLDMIMDIPVTLSVELGATRLSIRELLDLAQGSIIELDGLAGEPMDILINGYLVAQGEVVVVEDKYGVRITDIVNRAERIQKLSR